MITVFWKEMRENSRWALLAFLAMAAALIQMWRGSPLVFDSGPAGENSSNLWVGMIAAFTAIALGILQTRCDARPASRALLLQRGITAEEAFAGKLLAGLALYSFAVFLPLAAMALFIAINGIEHKAASAMSLVPMASLTVAAFAFWPAAMLIVHCDARAFGSRLMPAVPALTATLLCLAPVETGAVWLVFSLISALNLIVMLLAARSVFANSSQIATGTGRAALALTISIAFLVMFTFVASGIEWYRMRNVRVSVGPVSVNRPFVVLLGPEGRPWLGQLDYSHEDGTYELTQAAEMAIGRSVRDQLQPIAEDWRETPLWLVDSYYRHYVRGYWAPFVRIASAVAPGSAGFMPREWVFDHKADAILVYHLTVSGGWQQLRWQRVRQLRAPGQVPSFGEIRRIGRSDGDGNFTLVTSTGAFYVPGDGSAVVAMYQASTESPILDSVDHTHRTGYFYPTKAAQKDKPFSMMLRLADRVVLLESNLDETAASQARPVGEVGNLGRLYATEIQLPDELAEPKTLSIARDPQHSSTYLGLAQSGDPSERRIVWARFDASGRIAAQQEYTENTRSAITSDGLTFSAIVPPGVWPIFFGTLLVTTDADRIEEAWEKACAEAKEAPARTAGAVLLYLCPAIVGVLLSIWAARRRRLGRRQTRLGVAWGFLMGPAGGLSILAVYPRIVRERCISCRQPTRIDSENCEHCGHPADELPRTGIEIFDRDAPARSESAEAIGSS
jgi:hypothetical protein